MKRILRKKLAPFWRAYRFRPGWQQLLVFLAAVVLLQLLVPNGTTSLLARLDGKSLAFSNMSSVEKRYIANAKQLELRFDDKKVQILTEDVGYEVNTKPALKRIPAVTTSNKLIPFGTLYKLLKPAAAHSSINRDGKKQLAAAGKLVNKHSTVPKDAIGKITSNGELKITPEVAGKRYDLVELDQKITKTGVYGDPVVSMKAKRYAASIKASDFDDVQKHVEKLKDQTLSVEVNDKKLSVAPKVFLQFVEVAGKTKREIHLQFSTRGLEKLLAEWGKSYDVAPGVTTVTYLDGVETGRKVGEPGKAIDKQKAGESLQSWLAKPSGKPVGLVVESVPATVKENRRYSSTSAGLQARLTDEAAARGGGYNIVVQEVGGSGRSASVAGGSRTVLASTYKLFVAYAAYSLAEKGQLDLGKQVAGKSIEDCIGRAIVHSDNDCAKAVALDIGWAKCDEIVHAAGFSTIELNNYNASGVLSGEKTGSASDIAAFLRRLNEVSLLNSEHTRTLLGYMKRQIYRQGIPAGSSGATVADKVGFLGSYTHDAGIVYGKSSDYVIVIMSNRGSNWANIKEVSQLVHDFFKA
ncbi:MAG: serine hydrolase [Candidatus Saccharimonadales bacterium]